MLPSSTVSEEDTHPWAHLWRQQDFVQLSFEKDGWKKKKAEITLRSPCLVTFPTGVALPSSLAACFSEYCAWGFLRKNVSQTWAS